MFVVKYVKDCEQFKWISSFLSSNSVKFYLVGNFILIRKKEFLKLRNIKFDFFLKSKTIEAGSCELNLEIIEYSDKNKIYNYKLAEILFFISKKFNIYYKQEYDIDEYILRVNIFDRSDLIYSFIQNYNDGQDFLFLFKIFKGVVVMSESKESKIIDGISVRLSKFELDVSKYLYFIEKKYTNCYEISLEHKINSSLILIKNVNVDDEGNIISMGENRGLVF